MHDAFLPFFCITAWFKEMQGGCSGGRVKFGLWEEVQRIAGSHQKQQFNWNNLESTFFGSVMSKK